MYKLCKSESAAARQRELEAGLLRIMLRCRYEEISVSDLCQQLDIPRKSFYRYFSGKDGALHALLDHTLMEYETFPGSYRDGQSRSLEKDLERFFLFWLHHRPLLDALEKNKMSPILIQCCIESAMNGQLIPRRFLRTEDSETLEGVILFTICGLMTMVLHWHHSGYPQPAVVMAKTAVRLLSQPLFRQPSQFL